MTSRNYGDPIPNCFYRVGTKGIFFNEKGEFLLTKEDSGRWDFPGGGLDHDENPQEGLKREIKEETNLDTVYISKNPYSFFTTRHDRTNTPIAIILYEVKFKDLDFTTSRECEEIKFFSKEEALKDNICNNVKTFLQHFNPKNHTNS